jgi:hypothetical protein
MKNAARFLPLTLLTVLAVASWAKKVSPPASVLSGYTIPLIDLAGQTGRSQEA